MYPEYHSQKLPLSINWPLRKPPVTLWWTPSLKYTAIIASLVIYSCDYSLDEVEKIFMFLKIVAPALALVHRYLVVGSQSESHLEFHKAIVTVLNWKLLSSQQDSGLTRWLMTLGALQQVLTDFDLTHSTAALLSNHMVSKSELWLHSHILSLCSSSPKIERSTSKSQNPNCPFEEMIGCHMCQSG